MSHLTSVIFLIVFFGFVTNLRAESKKYINKSESISTRITLTGDISGTYELTGPIGVEVKGSPYDSKYPCEIFALFRKAQYRKKPAIETWLTLVCMFEGQKKTYKLHRIFVELNSSQKAHKLPILDKNIKNVRLEFDQFSLKIGS